MTTFLIGNDLPNKLIVADWSCETNNFLQYFKDVIDHASYGFSLFYGILHGIENDVMQWDHNIVEKNHNDYCMEDVLKRYQYLDVKHIFILRDMKWWLCSKPDYVLMPCVGEYADLSLYRGS